MIFPETWHIGIKRCEIWNVWGQVVHFQLWPWVRGWKLSSVYECTEFSQLIYFLYTGSPVPDLTDVSPLTLMPVSMGVKIPSPKVPSSPSHHRFNSLLLRLTLHFWHLVVFPSRLSNLTIFKIKSILSRFSMFWKGKSVSHIWSFLPFRSEINGKSSF